MLTPEEVDLAAKIWYEIERDVAHMTSHQDVFDQSLKEAQRSRKKYGAGLAHTIMIQSITEGVQAKKLPIGRIASRAHDSLLALQVGCAIGRYTSDRHTDQQEGAKIRKRYRMYAKTVSEILAANISRVNL